MATLNWTVLTLFPGAFRGGVLGESLLSRAVSSDLVAVTAVDIRDYAEGPHRVCDDTPYGGGPGMVLKPEPIVRAFRAVEKNTGSFDAVLAMSASGELFTDALARKFAACRHVCLLCGHYEGIDQRAIEMIGAREICVGNFIQTGGEIPALAVIDASSRYVPGFLGRETSTEEESFVLPGGILEYPHYTRPAEFEGRAVPEVLRNGDHAAIHEWRMREAVRRTASRRPDLLGESNKEGVIHGQSNRAS